MSDSDYEWRVSPLRDKVNDLLKEYHAESVVQMLVSACEDVVPSGAADDDELLPRAGNWCGIYTTLFEPLLQTLRLKEIRKKVGLPE